MQSGSTQTPPTHAWPEGQGSVPQCVGTQLPWLHSSPAEHGFPTHARSWQWPSMQTCSGPQFATAQSCGRHAPPAHVSLAPHATPHAPQFESSVAVCTQSEPHCV
jgi:hypothetical protein